jgi:hypothetical protein
VDDLDGVLLRLGLSGEGEDVLIRDRGSELSVRPRLVEEGAKGKEGRKADLGLAIGDLVDSEPLVGSSDETGKVPLDVLDVVELGGEGVVDVDDDDLPVGLTLVEESPADRQIRKRSANRASEWRRVNREGLHDTEDLDLLDLTDVADLLSDLANVEGVVVTGSLGLGVGLGRVLPGLGEGTVVPDVTVVREAVSDESELALRERTKQEARAVSSSSDLAVELSVKELTFLMSCLMGLKDSSLEISILAYTHHPTNNQTTEDKTWASLLSLAVLQGLSEKVRTLVHRGTSTIMLRMVLDSSAKRGISLQKPYRHVSSDPWMRDGSTRMSEKRALLEGGDDLALLLDVDSVLCRAGAVR